MPPGDVALVPAELARPLARLAVLGARALSDRDGGLVLAPGLASVISELTGFRDEPAVGSVSFCTARGEWVSAAQAAAMAGVSWQHITRLCRRGRLIARRGDYRWEVDRQSAEEYARSRAVA